MTAATTTLTLLRHSHNVQAKTWRADGSMSHCVPSKYFGFSTLDVSNIRQLSEQLSKLEGEPNCCIIRGRYVGDEIAAKVDPKHKPGYVRRTLDLFEDVPLPWLLVEIDKFSPAKADPVRDPVGSINEFISAELPKTFHGAAFHWQLSSSAGHPDNVGVLKAHVWFWLEQPATSNQLLAWATALQLPIDKAVFNPVQIHYTARPIFDAGVIDPVPHRSGFEARTFDAVNLVLSETPNTKRRQTRAERMERIATSDPVANALYLLGMVKSARKDGEELIVDCPRADKHTKGAADANDTSTIYRLPNTGGYEKGRLICLHEHCRDVPQWEFEAALGIVRRPDEFDVTDPAGTSSDVSAHKIKIPEARHLVTDQANAQRIIKHFKQHLMVTAGRWHAWTGTHWAEDDGEVYRCALNLSRILGKEADEWAARPAADDAEKSNNDAIAKALRGWGKRSEMRPVIEAALNLAGKMLRVDEAHVNRDPWLLNCRNGTVDLRTGNIRKHEPTDYITKLINIDFDPSAEAPVFRRTLAQITVEDAMGPTKPLAEFLGRWFGYCATGSTREQKFVVHYGPGRNGKSTLMDLISDVLGPYAGTAAPGLLLASDNQRHPTEIADLFGKRMVTAHESGEGKPLREEFVKHVTGSDKIKARYLYRDLFEFEPTHKIQLLTNHKPQIRNQDDGMWRRVLLMPYLASFGSVEEVASGIATHLRDVKISEALRKELPGVLAWIVRGAGEWYRDGLQPPDAVTAASKDYQAEQDRVRQFTAECCELGHDYSEVLTGWGGGLYTAYQRWCIDAGYKALGKTKFIGELERVVPHFHKDTVKEAAAGGTRRKNVVKLFGLRLLSDE